MSIFRQDPNLPDGVSQQMIDAHYGARPSDDAVADEMAIHADVEQVIKIAQERVRAAYAWANAEIESRIKLAKTRHLARYIEDARKSIDMSGSEADDGFKNALTDDLLDAKWHEDFVREEIEDAAQPDPDYLRDMREGV